MPSLIDPHAFTKRYLRALRKVGDAIERADTITGRITLASAMVDFFRPEAFRREMEMPFPDGVTQEERLIAAWAYGIGSYLVEIAMPRWEDRMTEETLLWSLGAKRN